MSPPVSAEVARLKRMRWSELEKRAFAVGVSLSTITGAKTKDELRLAILKAQHPEAKL